MAFNQQYLIKVIIIVIQVVINLKVIIDLVANYQTSFLIIITFIQDFKALLVIKDLIKPFVKALDYSRSYFSTFLDQIKDFKPLLLFMDFTSFIKLKPYPYFPYQAFPYQAYPYLIDPYQAFPFRTYPYPYFKMDLEVLIIVNFIVEFVVGLEYCFKIEFILKVYYVPCVKHIHR